MLEQQVRRPVQRNRRLAGTGAALHDEHLVDRCTDHDVLFGLDRRHDLAHLTGSFSADLCEHRIGNASGDLALVGIVDMLVEVGDDVALIEREPTSERHPERVDGRGAVERRSARCAPVDDDRIVVLVLVVAASDVSLVDPPGEVAGAWTLQILQRVGTVTSMYSSVISSAAPAGSTAAIRAIIRSRESRANASLARSAPSSGNRSAFTGAVKSAVDLRGRGVGFQRKLQGSSFVFVLVLVAYVIGTFPSAILIARANGVDISTFGSGNPGASNVTRALGWRKGVWVYLLDAGKGALAAGLGLALDGRPVAYWCAAAAVVGHMFPILRRFKGGKGVATGSGALLVVQPILAPLAVGIWWVVTRVTGKAALGSVIAVALVPIGIIAMDQPRWELIAVGGLCALILLKHSSNIKRMIRREEHSLGQN